MEINLGWDPLNKGNAEINTSKPFPLVKVARTAKSKARVNLNFELRSTKK